SGGSSKIGDADMDGQVTILDATRIQRVLADLETQIDRTAADADYDGKVTIIDATRIQRFIAGLITKL
ncbi:MAG: dockerin type I repeat-containing protein, partial [Ruminococcus sp.]|nr:dockerin type I repeat-containing protein [Ruminococcus sp.]